MELKHLAAKPQIKTVCDTCKHNRVCRHREMFNEVALGGHNAMVNACDGVIVIE